MDPYRIMNPMPVREPVGQQPSGDKSHHSSAAPFHVGSRLAINSSFVGVDHHTEDNEDDLRTFSPLVKTQSIPIRNRMKRTPSELELKQEEEQADFRDYVMFSRIVDRMSRSQKEMMNRHLRHENDQCLAHVIGTRNGCSDAVSVRKELKQQRPATEPRPTSLLPDPSPRVSFSEMDELLAMEDAANDTEDDEEEDIMFELEL